MKNKLRLVRIDSLAARAALTPVLHTYVQNSDPKGNFTIHDPSDGETISDLGNGTICTVSGGPVVSYENGDADDFWRAFDRLRNAADKMVLKFAGALGHTVVIVGMNARGERHARVESCDLKRCLAEAKADETVYQRAAKGWRRVRRSR